jgi:hypothetical protein
MKRAIVYAGVVAALMLAGGCFPEKRVSWSPDGRWATVKGADGLYLCDPSGKLSRRLVEDVGSVAWLPDSKQIVLSHSQTVKSWAQAAAVLSPERRQELEARAPKLRDEIMAYAGEWDKFKAKAVEGLTGGETLALFALVRDQSGAELQKKLGEKWEDFQKLEFAVHTLQLAAVKPDATLELGAVLAKGPDAFDELRVAPNGKAVAYRGAASGEDPAKPLFVLALDGKGKPRLVEDRTATYPDWSSDSRYVTYATSRSILEDGSKDLRLGVVARRLVADESGALLETLPDAEELAGIVFQNEVRVRCLRDGRVLFATLEVELPCTSKDMPQRAGLFAVDPGREPGVTRLTPREAEIELPDAIFLFEVSPDEQHVTVPGGNGRVAILTLATGDVWEIVGEKEIDHLRTEPTWRSSDELCFAFVPGPEGAKERAAIAVAKLDWAGHKAERKILSADWPGDVVTDFLVEKKQSPLATQPAVQKKGS